MTPAIAVAAVVTLSLALGSLLMQVDGVQLRRWRLSRRWDVSRLAREFIAAADEPLATVRGLKHMIYAWERGDRKPSERYWLLYLRVFPEFASAETAIFGADEPADHHHHPAAIDAVQAAPAGSVPSTEPQDIRTLIATVRALEQRIAGLSRRVDELSRDQHVRDARPVLGILETGPDGWAPAGASKSPRGHFRSLRDTGSPCPLSRLDYP